MPTLLRPGIKVQTSATPSKTEVKSGYDMIHSNFLFFLSEILKTIFGIY
jgi:hypothetical protein